MVTIPERVWLIGSSGSLGELLGWRPTMLALVWEMRPCCLACLSAWSRSWDWGRI